MGQIPSEGHINKALTNLAVNFRPTRFNLVADNIMPRIPVDNQADDYYVYNKDDAFSLPDSRRGPKAEASEATFGQSIDTFSCKDYAYKDLVLDKTLANADVPLNPKGHTTQFLTDLLLLDRERRIASICTDVTKITKNTTMVGGDQWSDYVNSHPITAVETARANLFFDPNTMIVPRLVHIKLRNHPDLLERYKYTNANGVLTEQMLADLFEVENYIVANAKYNSANPGQPAVMTDVWGKDVVLAYVDPAPNLEIPSFGYTMEWKMAAVGGINGMRVREYRKEEIGGGGTIVEVDCSHDDKIVSTDLAYLFKAAVA